MKKHRSLRQPDLFESAVKFPPAPPPADFVARIRGELAGTLTRMRDAVALPWKDLTTATLAELRFDSIAGWLPEDEAVTLRTEFHHELDRLYALSFPATGMSGSAHFRLNRCGLDGRRRVGVVSAFSGFTGCTVS